MTEQYTLPELDYHIIGSGSRGNAVRIEDIMIDCGMPYRDMKEELNKCRLLFITHKHGDHIRRETLGRIKKHHKQIKIAGNYQVAELHGVDIITGVKPLSTKKWKMAPFEVPHNVLCQGIVINFKTGIDVIYVTDSAGTKTWPDEKFDYLFIESNHDDTKLRMADKNRYGYDYISGAKRHTSYQESKAYYYLHRKGRESEWIELHKSERFY